MVAARRRAAAAPSNAEEAIVVDRRTTYAITLASPHEPARPSWCCRRDGEPWPCVVAQAQMAAEYGENLARRMFEQLVRAASDMPEAAAADLYARFVAWT